MEIAISLAIRIVKLLVALCLFIAGIAGQLLPIVPGLPLLFLGLVVISTEFSWAERWRDQMVTKFTELKDQLRPTPTSKGPDPD